MRKWQCEFYAGIVAATRGEQDRYLQSMRSVAGVSWIDFDSKPREFLAKIWQEEFFLARHEYSTAE